MDPAVRHLLDRLEIRDLVTKYYTSTDKRDFDGFRSCFVAGTGVDYSELLPVPSDHPIEDVSRVIEEAMAANYGATQHFMGSHEVTVDGDTGVGETYCLAMHRYLDDDREGGQRPVSALRYLDRYVRTADGWRIEHRRVTRDIAFFMAPREG